MLFWFIIKLLGKFCFWCFAVYGAWHALPEKPKQDGTAVLHRFLRWPSKLRYTCLILAVAMATLYVIGEVRHDWIQFKQAASKEDEAKSQLREEVLNLASQMEAAVTNWGANDTVTPHHQDFDSRFAQWIEEVRPKLSKHGPLPEIIKTYATMFNWTKSDILKLASELRAIATGLE